MASFSLFSRKQVYLKVATFLGALACLGLAQRLPAATYYVSPNGSDSSSGNSSSPFKTIQKAADSVGPGDTVILRNGTYTSNAEQVVYIARSGTASQWITFKAENKWGAVIDGRNFSTGHGIIIARGVGYVRIEGLQIQGTIYGGISGSEDMHDIVYYRNLVHDIGHVCTSSTGGLVGFRDKATSTRITYDSNVLHSIGRLSPSQGCSASANVYKNHDHGLYLHGTNIKIVNNVFYNFKNGWAIQSSEGAASWVISHNTFAFANPNREGQIVLWEGNKNITVANNIFYQPLRAAIMITPCAGKSNIVVRNNLSTTGDMIFNDDTGGSSCGNVSVSSNMTSTDPKLANPGAANFHLTAGSPAINIAAATLSLAVDLDGSARPQGGGYDLGAFEFGGQSSSSDKVAPTVSILTPATGATVSGSVAITANASDNVAVMGVQFQVDGANVGAEDTSAPYAVSWNASSASEGLHVITAIARDAAGNAGSTSATVRIGAGASTGKPAFSLTASPSTVVSGGASVLTWASQNAKTCTASGGWSGNKPLTGTQTLRPVNTASFTLTCTGTGGTLTKSVTVTVKSSSTAKAPTLSLFASPASIKSGQGSTLTWSSQNATSCTASGGWSGLKAVAGSFAVKPTTTRSFTLTCKGTGGSVARSATITVAASSPGTLKPPSAAGPALTFSAYPTKVKAGGVTTLMWSAGGASYCVASGPWSGNKPTSAGQSFQLNSSATFVLKCGSSKGTTTKSVSVSVTR